MRFYTVDLGTKKLLKQARAYGWGRLFIHDPVRLHKDDPCWALDNGCFRDYKAGLPFQEVAYLSRVMAAMVREAYHGPPEFLVVPDKVAGGMESLAYSLEWLDRLPDTGWPLYLVVQNGMTPQAVLPSLHRFQGLFLGGTPRFKRMAPVWCELAHQQGLKFHYGAAHSWRLREAYFVGADSADSSDPSRSHQEWADFCAVWEQLHHMEPRKPRTILSRLGIKQGG